MKFSISRTVRNHWSVTTFFIILLGILLGIKIACTKESFKVKKSVSSKVARGETQHVYGCCNSVSYVMFALTSNQAPDGFRREKLHMCRDVQSRIGLYQNLPGKLGQQSAIYWNSLGLCRDYGLNYIFFRNKTFFVFQDRKLKFSASV